MHKGGTDIVLAIDAHHPKLLIAHRYRGGFLEHGLNFGIRDVGGLGHLRGLGMCLIDNNEREQQSNSSFHCPVLRRVRPFEHTHAYSRVPPARNRDTIATRSESAARLSGWLLLDPILDFVLRLAEVRLGIGRAGISYRSLDSQELPSATGNSCDGYGAELSRPGVLRKGCPARKELLTVFEHKHRVVAVGSSAVNIVRHARANHLLDLHSID